MSRSIGDAAAHQIGVSALPVVMQYKLSDADRLLIIATDGVWDMLDNSEVVDIAARASGDCKGDPAYASAQVCQTARRAWEFKETRVDDITCLLVFLQHWRESASVPPVTDSVSTSPSQEIYQAYGRPTAGGDASYTSMGACAQESPSYTPLSRQDAPEAYSAEKREQLANSQAAQASGQVSYMALSRDAYSRGQEPAPSYHTIQPGEQTQNADKSYTHHHWPPAPASHEFGASSSRPWMAPEGRGAQQPPPATGGIQVGAHAISSWGMTCCASCAAGKHFSPARRRAPVPLRGSPRYYWILCVYNFDGNLCVQPCHRTGSGHVVQRGPEWRGSAGPTVFPPGASGCWARALARPAHDAAVCRRTGTT